VLKDDAAPTFTLLAHHADGQLRERGPPEKHHLEEAAPSCGSDVLCKTREAAAAVVEERV
jgi:hypothetical protein